MHMRGKLITLVCVILSFMTCLLGIGYAAISGELHITGDAVFGSFPIYITEVERYSASAATNALNKTIYSITFMNSKITLDGCQDGESSSDVVLAITVENASTDNDYAYIGVIGAEEIADLTVGVYADAECTVDLDCFNGVVQKRNGGGEKQRLTFYVKLSHTQDVSTEYNPILAFRFVEAEDMAEAAKQAVAHKFLQVLNNETKYKTLTDAMFVKQQYVNRNDQRNWLASYIGNVPGAYDEDKTVVNELLGTLQLYINEEIVDVTCIINRSNFDANNSTGDLYTAVSGTIFRGCEMALYMFAPDSTAYVMVFTKKSTNADWEQIGTEMYEGTATVSNYFVVDNKLGSFDTSSWRSNQAYHGVNTNSTLENIIKACLREQAS